MNEPLEVDGTLVHILNPGYAPEITVRDADGTVLAEGRCRSCPRTTRSPRPACARCRSGRRSVSARTSASRVVLQTAVVDDRGPRSIFPEPRNPALFLTAFHGDLGLDDGQPQSVYRLDTSRMEQFRARTARPSGSLAVGETVQLPDGYGGVTFDGYVSWVNLQIGRNAGKEFVLAGRSCAGRPAVVAVDAAPPPWVRSPSSARAATVVEIAGLQRSEGGDLEPRSTASPTVWPRPRLGAVHPAATRTRDRGRQVDARSGGQWSRFLVAGAIAAFIVAG